MRLPRLWFAKRKDELDEELRAHLRMAMADRMARGETEAEARQNAMREMGNLPLIEEVTRAMWGGVWLERVAQDVRYALRQLRRAPGFAVTVVVTLALGIAAAAAMFTVVDHVLLQPTPYRDPSRLVLIKESDGSSLQWDVPWPDLRQWIDQSRSFEQIAFSTAIEGGRNYLETPHVAMEVAAERASSNLFETLGVRPQLGRGFIPEAPGFASKNASLIVLSDVVWKEAFHADKGILGQTVRINSMSYTVAGVMPPGFRYPADAAQHAQVWIGLQLRSQDNGRDWQSDRFAVIARLRPGVRAASAQAEMQVIQKPIAATISDPDERKQSSQVRVERYDGTLVKAEMRRALVALLAAAGVLWLIAAVNVTNLLLARGTARQRELAVRAALGAGRWRIVQQMLVEGLVLSGGATILGAGLALGAVRLLAHELTQRLPLPVPARPNGAVLLALLGLTLVSALLSSAWPAFLAARAPIEPALKQGGMQAGTGRQQHRMRGALVAIEIALSLTLLAACGLLLRTLYSLRHVPLGYRTDHIVVASLDIPSFRFAHQDMTRVLYEPLLERVQHLGGVQVAGLMSEVPLSNAFSISLEMYGDNKSRIIASMKSVTPEMLKVFGFQMAAGRYFNAQDTATSQPVMVVNEAFARLYSSDKHNPHTVLGTKFLEMQKNSPAKIIGILADTHQHAVSDPSQPEVEIDVRQLTPDVVFYNSLEGFAMDLALRTDRPESEIIPELRQILRQASPELTSANITTMDQIVEDSYGSQRLAAHLLEIFGISALLLSIAGLYGLLAYVVTQRTRELGVRIALGASRGNLLWLVMRQAGAMLVAGVAVGTGLAWASARVVGGFLYGVKAHDSRTMAVAAVLLLLSGLAASYLPARRAAGVDPMEALRSE